MATYAFTHIVITHFPDRPGLMTEMAASLRRDYRYAGHITLASFEPVALLQDRNDLGKCLGTAEPGRWKVDVLTLPCDSVELTTRSRMGEPLAAEELREFIRRFCSPIDYLKAEWGIVAHDLAKLDWRARLQTEWFRKLLRSTQEFLPFVPDSPAGLGLAGLASKAFGDERLVHQAVIAVQSNLLEALPNEDGAYLPEQAVPGADIILVADDTPYDTRELQARGYRVIATDSPEEARDILEDVPAAFLCDATWGDDRTLGLDLVRQAVRRGVRAVILMSAGPLPASLPRGVVRCEGLVNKYDAHVIHRLIVQRWVDPPPANEEIYAASVCPK